MQNITKLLGNQWEKKERKVLQDTSTGFKPYPKTSELTKKSNLSRSLYSYKFRFCSLLFLEGRNCWQERYKKGRFSVCPMLLVTVFHPSVNGHVLLIWGWKKADPSE